MKWQTARFRWPVIVASYPGEVGAEDRQDRVPGFRTEAAKQKKGVLVGAGGINGAVAPALARKGYGELRICDSDSVELSNLSRQAFFPWDLYRAKALSLARNASRESCLGTLCEGHVVDFTPETAERLSDGVDFAVVGVDSDYTRAFASRYFRSQKMPAIFTAVNENADRGWVFVQEAEGPCLGCVFPHLADVDKTHTACQPSPAVIDVVRLVGAVVSYACDTLVMERGRRWNYKSLSLLGDEPDFGDTIRPREGCGLCGMNNGAAEQF